MKDYVKRMIDEANELHLRHEKLSEKIADKDFMQSIGSAKSGLLVIQANLMETYLCVLMTRLKLEDIEVNDGNRI